MYKVDESLKQKILELLLSNRRVVGDYQFTLPSPRTYPYQWFWDSCFHAIILSHFNPEDAKKELLSLLTHQFDNGMIPHMIYWKTDGRIEPENNFLRHIDWGKDDTSTITQPPMLAYAAMQIYRKERDREFLKLIYDSVLRLYRYLLKDRDPHGHNLVGIINPDESGEDNSPRFDTALELPVKQTISENFAKRLELVEKNKSCNFDAPYCMHNFFWVKDVPFNAILIENLRISSDIAAVLHREREQEYFSKEADKIERAMRKLMLEDGIFWSTQGPNYLKIKVKTWAVFAPLFAGIYTKDEAKNLVNNYLLNDKEFKSDFMLPTVSRSDASFDPTGFWRGPVWSSPNWFVFQGLRRYGYDDLAERIFESTQELLQKSGFREYFNPFTGEGLGAYDFTWGGLIVDMNI